MEASTKSPARVRFGEFELDLRTGELRSNGNKTYLQEKPFQILALLVERPGQLVTRGEMTKTLWPSGTFVDFDVSLNKAVNRLREALGDSAEHPRFIETLPRRGYRLIASVSRVDSRVGANVAGLTAAVPTRAWKIVVPVAVIVLAVVVAVGVRWHSWRGHRL